MEDVSTSQKKKTKEKQTKKQNKQTRQVIKRSKFVNKKG
jgi:hypothetical protein